MRPLTSKGIHSAIPVFLLALACSDPQDSAEKLIDTESSPLSAVNGDISASEIIERAQYWYNIRNNSDMNYNQGGYHADSQGKSYRRDCSGYVSMAWHLDHSRVTYQPDSLANVSDRIGKDQLQPGDLIMAPTTDGHAILFEKWVDSTHTWYWAYEFGSTPVSHHKIQTSGNDLYVGDSRTYYAYHYRKNVGGSQNNQNNTPAIDLENEVPITGDFNGDGRADLAMWYHHADNRIQLLTNLATAGGGFGDFRGSYTVPANAWDWNSFKTVVGDFNGDKRSDLAIMYHHADGSLSLNSSFADVNGNFGGFSGSWSIPASAYWDWNAIRLFAGDFNGDGRSDVAMMYHHADGRIQLFTCLADSNGNFTDFSGSYTVPANAWDWNSFRTVVGDFNGDKRSDLAVMYRHSDGSLSMHTSLSDANGHFGQFFGSLSISASAYWDWRAIRLFAGDFNGDGRSDVAMMYHHGNNSIQLFTSLSSSNGGFTDFFGSYTVPTAAWDWNSFKAIAGDFNGDKKADAAIMYHHSDNSLSLHTSLTSANGAFNEFFGSWSIPASAYWDWNAIRVY